MSELFSLLKIRSIDLKNRIAVSPMCQYSCNDGIVNDWHLVHLGSRAVGGAGLVMTEATAVSPEGRISPDDAGIWNDEQAEAYKKITAFIKSQYSIPGIQLAHAGRKASTYSPWKGSGKVELENGGWVPIAPTSLQFASNYHVPKEMSTQEIKFIVEQFVKAARRSIEAGFRVIELHAAHGYLLHEFLSPLTNHRLDEYGGSIESRSRIVLEIVQAIRNTIPEGTALFVRLSCTDWIADGWNIDDSIWLAEKLKSIGVDLIDCSSGGILPNIKIPTSPAYQIPFSSKIKNETGILTAGVGLITTPEQAEQIISSNQADIVFLGREMLRNPYWALNAAKKLNVDINDWPKQYLRAK